MSSITHVHYQVSVSSIAGHLFDIKQHFTATSDTQLSLQLPAWIPGSYMIRDFARNIVRIEARDQNEQTITLTKSDKQSWLFTAHKGQKISVSYQVYAYDLSVRSAYINDQYAFFNGTSLFLEVSNAQQASCSVEINNNREFRDGDIATSLPKDQDTGYFVADNYLQLIDHPFLLGYFERYPFEASGVTFELILAGGHQADTNRIVKDLAKICNHHLQIFGTPYPIQHYLFITLLCDDGFGGLEHTSSTVLQYARKELPDIAHAEEMTEGYRTFLSLCSHELFHTWHVKSSKPENMLKPDLSQEVYTEQLWIYEGFTSYFDDLALLRCKLIDEQEYLQIMAMNMTRLARNPGAQLQTVTESSFDAWSRFYKQDANATNSIVSYYTKGAVIAMCLDLKIRLDSNHRYSLFDLVTQLWRDIGLTEKGSNNDAIHVLLKQHFDLDLDDFLNSMIYTTAPLPDIDLLAKFGVKTTLRPRVDHKDKGGKPSTKLPKYDFGAMFSGAPIGVKITQVIAERAAYRANLHVNDLLIAIDGWQVNEQSIQSTLDNCDVQKQSCELSVLRDGRLIQLSLPIIPAISDTVVLETIDSSLRDRWLHQPQK